LQVTPEYLSAKTEHLRLLFALEHSREFRLCKLRVILPNNSRDLKQCNCPAYGRGEGKMMIDLLISVDQRSANRHVLHTDQGLPFSATGVLVDPLLAILGLLPAMPVAVQAFLAGGPSSSSFSLGLLSFAEEFFLSRHMGVLLHRASMSISSGTSLMEGRPPSPALSFFSWFLADLCIIFGEVEFFEAMAMWNRGKLTDHVVTHGHPYVWHSDSPGGNFRK
jgi:hypothetical protein